MTRPGGIMVELSLKSSPWPFVLFGNLLMNVKIPSFDCPDLNFVFLID